jgi:hypothetical protein
MLMSELSNIQVDERKILRSRLMSSQGFLSGGFAPAMELQMFSVLLDIVQENRKVQWTTNPTAQLLLMRRYRKTLIERHPLQHQGCPMHGKRHLQINDSCITRNIFMNDIFLNRLRPPRWFSW